MNSWQHNQFYIVFIFKSGWNVSNYIRISDVDMIAYYTNTLFNIIIIIILASL